MPSLSARLLPLVACLAVFGGALAGCITMDVPERFLVVERSPAALRALTPEESKIWVRDFDDDTKGSLSFWRDALKADLLKNRGYALLAETTVQDGEGHEGALLTLETTLGGRPMRELLAVFVIPGLCANTIRVAEYIADVDAFEAEKAAVTASLSTLR